MNQYRLLDISNYQGEMSQNRQFGCPVKSDADACHRLVREKEQARSRIAYLFTMIAC
jgi:hypothetical protein